MTEHVTRAKTLVPVMRTVDRSPRHNYLFETLAGAAYAELHVASALEILPLQIVDSGGGSEAWYYALGGAGAIVPVAVHTSFTGRVNNNQNGLRALEVGLATGADYVMHLEDDLLFCSRFGTSVTRWLAEHAREDVPFYTFHTPYKQVRDAYARGDTSWDYPARLFYGNQCWVMSRAYAESAVAFLRERVPTWRSSQGFDMLLKEWVRDRCGNADLLASAPCFVQHAGEQSSLNNRFHNNQSWPGFDWTYRGPRQTEIR